MSVQKREWTNKDGKRQRAFRVRWQDGNVWRSETFERKKDADDFDSDVRRRKSLGTLAELHAGTQTLDAYVADVFTPTYVRQLAPKTQQLYAGLYDAHVSPYVGSAQLRAINAETVRRWQADLVAAGAPAATRAKAHTLLGSILQRAFEGDHVQKNAARQVRKVKVPKPAEVRPLAPATVERLRAAMLNPARIEIAASVAGARKRQRYTAPAPGTDHTRHRDATLVSVMAYAGLRPGEALGLRWGDVREYTLIIERAVSLGREADTKTGAHRTVRLLDSLAGDLREWRLRSGRPADDELIFPSADGRVWTPTDYGNWRKRNFARALSALAVKARPYDLRHSFASLLLHEGRSVIYVARQLGHGAQLTLRFYGHVIEELDGAPHTTAETAISEARAATTAHELPIAAAGAC